MWLLGRLMTVTRALQLLSNALWLRDWRLSLSGTPLVPPRPEALNSNVLRFHLGHWAIFSNSHLPFEILYDTVRRYLTNRSNPCLPFIWTVLPKFPMVCLFCQRSYEQ